MTRGLGIVLLTLVIGGCTEGPSELEAEPLASVEEPAEPAPSDTVDSSTAADELPPPADETPATPAKKLGAKRGTAAPLAAPPEPAPAPEAGAADPAAAPADTSAADSARAQSEALRNQAIAHGRAAEDKQSKSKLVGAKGDAKKMILTFREAHLADPSNPKAKTDYCTALRELDAKGALGRSVLTGTGIKIKTELAKC